MIQSVNALPPQPIDPPSGIGSVSDIKRAQRALGVRDDGIWGPITQAAYEKIHLDSFASELAKAVSAANDAQRQAQIDAQLSWKPGYTAPEAGSEQAGETDAALLGALQGVTGSAATQTAATQTASGNASSDTSNEAFRMGFSTASTDVGASTTATDDEAYLESILQQNAVKVAQQALGVSQTGQWDAATRAAYANNPGLLTTGVYYPDGSQRIAGEVRVMSGNVRTPWATEDERMRINNEFAAMYGFAGYDGCGGIFGKNGMSSNPYYVQDKTGMTRDQLNSAGLSQVPDAVLGSDLWRQGFLQLCWNGYSVQGNGLGWPPTLIKQPKSMGGLDVFLGVDNGNVNWNTLLAAQPSTKLGQPVNPVTPSRGETWETYVV